MYNEQLSTYYLWFTRGTSIFPGALITISDPLQVLTITTF